MKMYLWSALAGVLVGVVYGLIQVRSPAPPVVALVGLLGILAGEQAVPIVKRWLGSEPVTAAWMKQRCGAHVFGELPRGSAITETKGNHRG